MSLHLPDLVPGACAFVSMGVSLFARLGAGYVCVCMSVCACVCVCECVCVRVCVFTSVRVCCVHMLA